MNFWECNELLKFGILENTASDMILTGITVEFMYFRDGLSTFYPNPHALNRERDESKVHCMKWTLELCNELLKFGKSRKYSFRHDTDRHSSRVHVFSRRPVHVSSKSPRAEPRTRRIKSSLHEMNFGTVKWTLQWTLDFRKSHRISKKTAESSNRSSQ